MGFLDIFLIGVALSMDAFSVSVCKGLSVKKVEWKHLALCGLYFGGFQFLMPILGYYLGSWCVDFIGKVDHWVAFGLLALIGLNMIRAAIFDKDDDDVDASFAVPVMLSLALATSIDALAVGVTFSLPSAGGVNVWLAAALIGVTTFVLSALGVKLGSKVGEKFEKSASIVGGAVLVLLGLKILLTDLGIISLPF